MIRVIISDYVAKDMKHENTLCGQHAKIFNAQAGGKYTSHCVLSCIYRKMLNLISLQLLCHVSENQMVFTA